MARTNIKHRILVALIPVLCGLFVFQPVLAQTADEINAQIQQKKDQVAQLQQQAAALQANIDSAAAQVNSYQSEISLIDQQVAQTNFLIDAKQQEIDGLQLQMTAIQQTIDAKNAAINADKDSLTAAIKQLDANSRTSTLSLILKNGSFADYFSQAEAVGSISQSLHEGITSISAARDALQAKQDELSQTKDQYQQGLLQLQVQQQSVVQQKDFKASLLSDAQNQKSSFQDQLTASIQQEQQADSSINALNAQLRSQLNGGGLDVPAFTSKGYIWPVSMSFGITTYFHDPNYPFNYIAGYCAKGQKPPACGHPGIDIGAPQGTPVRAIADGVVSKVQDSCIGTPNEGFIMSDETNCKGTKVRSALTVVAIVHDNPISSVYLHLSRVIVHTEQFVKQGDIIGYSGGNPGTGGAGGITTGAHLHFEIRNGGIPDDPLAYLPSK